MTCSLQWLRKWTCEQGFILYRILLCLQSAHVMPCQKLLWTLEKGKRFLFGCKKNLIFVAVLSVSVTNCYGFFLFLFILQEGYIYCFALVSPSVQYTFFSNRCLCICQCDLRLILTIWLKYKIFVTVFLATFYYNNLIYWLIFMGMPYHRIWF